MKSLIYLLPFENQSSGIRFKVDGQKRALSAKYEIQEYGVVPIAANRLVRVGRGLISEILLGWKLFRVDSIYYRYCPHICITSLWLCFFSFFKEVFIEYNSVIKDELSSTNSSGHFRHVFNKVVYKFSRIIHLPVTTEIGEKESLVRARTFSNGYETNHLPNQTLPDRVVSQILLQKDLGKKVLVMCCSGIYAWNGDDVVHDLFGNREDVFVVLAGKYEARDWSENFLLCGALPLEQVYSLYKIADFGIGTFALHRKGLQEACTLKVREYLCNGLPVILGHKDVIMDESWASEYFFQIDSQEGIAPQKLEEFLNKKFDRDILKEVAIRELSWTRRFELAGVL